MSEFASTYDELASRWDDWAGAVVPPVRLAWAAKIVGHAQLGERVVELGCGTGVPVGELFASGYDYTGVDASDGMLAAARVLLPGTRLVHLDMEDANFAARSLGAVIAFYSMIHVPREQHAGLFARISTWLRPGGAFVASLHSRDEPDDYEPDWLGAGPTRWTGYDRRTNLELITSTGLEVIESEVIEQTEPGGLRIRPLWILARRPD